MEKIIDIKNIKLIYQTADTETLAVSNISFQVEKGEFVGIIGPSGCGKSTLLSVISGLLPASSGYVNIPEDTRIGYMLQKDYLFDWLTIKENVSLGLSIKGEKTPENLQYVDKLLTTYGLYEFKDSYPSQLSGGMRQRCALIRTLAIKPDILLLDEAFSALDYQTRLVVADDIYSIIKKEGKTVVMVTHDISECISMADRIIVLTKRPAEIKRIYDIRFKEESLSPLRKREAPEFSDYFNRIWGDIDVHV